MKSNIIQSQEIEQNVKFLGNKTLNLKKGMAWGFNVPKFIAIPTYACTDLYTNKISREETAQKIAKILQCKKYAIRSSALIEDTAQSSLAGQFLTKLNISDKKLAKNIYTVLKQANNFLQGNLEKFSMIIQEYIDADVSGVTFTRNPAGKREMIIEYGFCDGEKIVSGKISPQKISLYWNEEKIVLPKQFSVAHNKSSLKSNLIKNFKNIEHKNKFPQDIEWCIKKNKFYLLQTRPITTISNKQYTQIVTLEKQLPKNEKYIYEKTEISEIAPRPTQFTLDLLGHIYSQDGPVKNVYQKHKVNFINTHFLKIIGNELYVDKEREIQSLLSAYSYLKNKKFIPRFNNYFKIIPTIKNLFFLNQIKTENYKQLFQALKTKIETAPHEKDFKTALKKFITDYELIFEINLLSGLAIKKLNFLLKNEVVKLPAILNTNNFFVNLNKYKVTLPKNLVGNSLDISDKSNFLTNTKTETQLNNNISLWWENTSDIQKKLFKKKIKEAIIYNHLRELGRWLTVKNITAIRNTLITHPKANEFNDPDNIYFSNIDEIINKQINEDICRKRKNIYNQYDNYNFPDSITSTFIDKKTKLLGVSAGSAQGILQDHNYLESKKLGTEKYILYTETLSPDLTKYFNKISGIVSRNGGVLSHLAIIAREKNIPVIVGFSLSSSNFKLGDLVEINGDNNEVKVIQKII